MAIASKELKTRATTSARSGGLDWAKVLTWVMLVNFPLAFFCILISPSDYVLKYSQRIFYFHLPTNILSFVAFGAYFVGGIAYFRTRKRKWDIVMMVGLELGVFFSLIGVVTGSIWARYAWGTFWTWDPRLTTVTIMLVVYIAGWMLRGAVEDPNRKAALTAVFGIIGFADVPLVYFSTRFFPAGLHPIVFGNNGEVTNLEGFMNVTVLVTMLAVTELFVYLFIQRVRLETLRDEVAAVRVALYEDEED